MPELPCPTCGELANLDFPDEQCEECAPPPDGFKEDADERR